MSGELTQLALVLLPLQENVDSSTLKLAISWICVEIGEWLLKKDTDGGIRSFWDEWSLRLMIICSALL
ncbi:hypothetical protein EPI10_027480 [Gossypium australe]|uniref:Uncharacterized protein n=1 Tax=Gossypium australe TaxID=47621 RepID=A0A5B6USU9_9ROSI|nr:hypothetical protein EPI10_027480 [Gossypium australe]